MTNFTGGTQDINSWNEFENHTCKITSTFLRGLSVNIMVSSHFILVVTTHLNITKRFQATWSSDELQLLGRMIGYQESSSSNGYQLTYPICMHENNNNTGWNCRWNNQQWFHVQSHISSVHKKNLCRVAIDKSSGSQWVKPDQNMSHNHLEFSHFPTWKGKQYLPHLQLQKWPNFRHTAPSLCILQITSHKS